MLKPDHFSSKHFVVCALYIDRIVARSKQASVDAGETAAHSFTCLLVTLGNIQEHLRPSGRKLASKAYSAKNVTLKELSLLLNVDRHDWLFAGVT